MSDGFEGKRSSGSRSAVEVGRSHGSIPLASRPLSEAEVAEWAEVCIALLKHQGQAVERTLSGMSAEAGGFILPEDAARIRDFVAIMLRA